MERGVFKVALVVFMAAFAVVLGLATAFDLSIPAASAQVIPVALAGAVVAAYLVALERRAAG